MGIGGPLVENAGEVQLICHSLQVTEPEALKKVKRAPEGLLFWRWRRLRAELVYKPLWVSEAELLRFPRSPRDKVLEVSVLIDGLTGIARCRKGEPVEGGCVTVNVARDRVCSPEVSEADAERNRDRILQQISTKDGYEVWKTQEPGLVYRPVWLIEGCRKRGYHMVDAHTGYLAKSFP